MGPVVWEGKLLLMPSIAEGVLNRVGRIPTLLTAEAPLARGVARTTGHPELGRSRLLCFENQGTSRSMAVPNHLGGEDEEEEEEEGERERGT